jgi:hypothetical protein
VIRLAEGELEAQAGRVVRAAFLDLGQCGGPVDVRLTYSQ